MPSSVFARLGHFAVRFRWVIVGFWLAIVLACVPFAPRITSALSPGGFGSADMESVRAGGLLQEKLHAQFTSVAIFFSSSTLKASDPRFIQEATAAVAPLTSWSEIGQVISFVSNPHQISFDGHSAYTTVFLKRSADSAPRDLGALRQRLDYPADLRVLIGGDPVFFADIQAVSEADLERAELITFPFALIALLLVFRSVVAAALPAAVGGFSVIIALALVYFLALHTTISVFALNITTIFGLGLGVDYSLFMVSRFREELADGRAVTDAIAVTMDTAGRAVSVSATAVSIGLLGLLIFRFNVLQSIGIGGVLVVLLALAAALTLLPALLAIAGTHVNDLPVRLPRLWGRDGTRRARNGTKDTKISENGDARKTQPIMLVGDLAPAGEGFWHRLSLRVMRQPWRFFLPVLAFLLLLGTPYLAVRLSAPDASILPQRVPSRAAFDLLQTHFDANETNPVILAVQTDQGNVFAPQNLAALESLIVRLQHDPRVGRVDSILSLDPRLTFDQYKLLYSQAPNFSDPYFAQVVPAFARGDTTLVSIVSKYGMIDPHSEALVQDIRATRFPGLRVLVTGGTAGVVDYVNTLYSQFPIAILIVALATYVVLMLLFQSVILPLKALAMNTLSILSAYGALVFIFQQGHFSNLLGFTPLGFVEASAPILMFCALFGLSMDYEVFLLSRIREEWLRTGDNVHSVALGMERSGVLITSAAAIVVIVSGGFASADMILVKALGVGMALAVLMDASLVRGLLVPSTMRLLGKWNWWWPFGGQPHPLTPSPFIVNGEGGTTGEVSVLREDERLAKSQVSRSEDTLP